MKLLNMYYWYYWHLCFVEKEFTETALQLTNTRSKKRKYYRYKTASVRGFIHIGLSKIKTNISTAMLVKDTLKFLMFCNAVVVAINYMKYGYRQVLIHLKNKLYYPLESLLFVLQYLYQELFKYHQKFFVLRILKIDALVDCNFFFGHLFKNCGDLFYTYSYISGPFLIYHLKSTLVHSIKSIFQFNAVSIHKSGTYY
jgi:hypothetical protein